MVVRGGSSYYSAVESMRDSLSTLVSTGGGSVDALDAMLDAAANPIGATVIGTAVQTITDVRAVLTLPATVHSPISITFYNAGANSIFLGGSDVDTTIGFTLAVGAYWTCATDPVSPPAIWAVVAGGQSVAIRKVALGV